MAPKYYSSEDRIFHSTEKADIPEYETYKKDRMEKEKRLNSLFIEILETERKLDGMKKECDALRKEIYHDEITFAGTRHSRNCFITKMP